MENICKSIKEDKDENQKKVCKNEICNEQHVLEISDEFEDPELYTERDSWESFDKHLKSFKLTEQKKRGVTRREYTPLLSDAVRKLVKKIEKNSSVSDVDSAPTLKEMEKEIEKDDDKEEANPENFWENLDLEWSRYKRNEARTRNSNKLAGLKALNETEESDDKNRGDLFREME